MFIIFIEKQKNFLTQYIYPPSTFPRCSLSGQNLHPSNNFFPFYVGVALKNLRHFHTPYYVTFRFCLLLWASSLLLEEIFHFGEKMLPYFICNPSQPLLGWNGNIHWAFYSNNYMLHSVQCMRQGIVAHTFNLSTQEPGRFFSSRSGLFI